MKFCVLFVSLIVFTEGFYVHQKKHHRQVRADETDITSTESPQVSSTQSNVPECVCRFACSILCTLRDDVKRIGHHKNRNNVNNKKHHVRTPDEPNSSSEFTQFLGCTCHCDPDSSTTSDDITQNPQEVTVNNEGDKKHHKKHHVKHHVFKKSHQ